MHGAGWLEKMLLKGVQMIKELFPSPSLPPPERGILLGFSQHPTDPSHFCFPIYWQFKLRPLHGLIAGGSGMGKSMLLRVMMRQDIKQGNGFALFDPHGELVEAILSECALHPEALERVWLVEPHSPFTLPFNPLSVPDGLSIYPQILTLLDLFRRSWSDFWGPRVEEVMRACLVTLSEQKLTLAELPLLLMEPSIRKTLTNSIQHEETRQFWHRFETLSPSLQALYAEPVINRVNRFLSDPSIKAMLCSQKGVNFTELMDKGDIVLVNLSKGQLKEISLIGSLLLAQFYWAALSRLNKLSHQRRLFTIYLDEFQNFLTDAGHTEDMLAEVRKCKVGLVMVTQCLAFLDRTLRASVLANTSLQIFFRLNPQDAGLVSGEISLANRKFWMQKLLNLPPRCAVCLLRGESRPSILRTPDCPDQFDPATVVKVREIVVQRRGQKKEDVLKEIRERHERLRRLEFKGGVSDGAGRSSTPPRRQRGAASAPRKPAIPSFKEAEPF